MWHNEGLIPCQFHITALKSAIYIMTGEKNILECNIYDVLSSNLLFGAVFRLFLRHYRGHCYC